MQESYCQYKNTYSFIRSSSLLPNRKTLLFLHGIGDSSISYIPFLQSQAFKNYNLLIPDLLGYGKSSAHEDYSFNTQCAAIREHLYCLENQYCAIDEIILVPHSMGAIHAMLLCQSDIKHKIKGVVSIEGSITQYGGFVSEMVAKVEKNGNFDAWFCAFKQSILNEYIQKFPACQTYYASLEYCQPLAFMQNALEMRKISLQGTGEYTNLAGKIFTELAIPKVYCYGDQSLCPESVDFLQKNTISTQIFHSNCHFVMLQCFEDFASFLERWVACH